MLPVSRCIKHWQEVEEEEEEPSKKRDPIAFVAAEALLAPCCFNKKIHPMLCWINEAMHCERFESRGEKLLRTRVHPHALMYPLGHKHEPVRAGRSHQAERLFGASFGSVFVIAWFDFDSIFTHSLLHSDSHRPKTAKKTTGRRVGWRWGKNQEFSWDSAICCTLDSAKKIDL